MSYYEFALFAGAAARSDAPLIHPQDPLLFGRSHAVGAAIENAISAGSTATAVPELDCPLKVGALYQFEYNLIYSISGLFVGAQFGVSMPVGGVDSIGYSVMLAADGSTLRSVAAAVLGTQIGSGSSFSGGGPWSCNITGALRVSSAADPVARLMFKGSGASVSVTLQPNSCAYFQEV